MLFKYVLIACLVSYASASGIQCIREPGDQSLGIVALVQISLGSPAVLNQNYPDCRITCIRCVNILGLTVGVTLNAGGYGCSNCQGLVNLGISIGLCQIFGVKLAAGTGVICPT